MKNKTHFSNKKKNSPKPQAKAAKLKSVIKKTAKLYFSILKHDDFFLIKIADFLQP